MKWQLICKETPVGIVFETDSLECAALATLLATSGSMGSLGAAEIDGDRRVPAFPNGGDDSWLIDHFGASWQALIAANASGLADCLASFRGLGDPRILEMAWRASEAFTPAVAA